MTRPTWITRFDYRDGHQAKGWWVRIVWKGRLHARFFADSKNGGKQNARERAMRWRDATLASLDRPPAHKIINSPRRKMTGVTVRTGQATAHFHIEPQVRRTKSYSLRVYGRARAIRMAMAWRRRMERQFWGGLLPR